MLHTSSPKQSKKDLPHCQTELGLVSGLGLAGAGGFQVKNEEIYSLLADKKIVQQIDLSVCHL